MNAQHEPRAVRAGRQGFRAAGAADRPPPGHFPLERGVDGGGCGESCGSGLREDDQGTEPDGAQRLVEGMGTGHGESWHRCHHRDGQGRVVDAR